MAAPRAQQTADVTRWAAVPVVARSGGRPVPQAAHLATAAVVSICRTLGCGRGGRAHRKPRVDGAAHRPAHRQRRCARRRRAAVARSGGDSRRNRRRRRSRRHLRLGPGRHRLVPRRRRRRGAATGSSPGSHEAPRQARSPRPRALPGFAARAEVARACLDVADACNDTDLGRDAVVALDAVLRRTASSSIRDLGPDGLDTMARVLLAGLRRCVTPNGAQACSALAGALAAESGQRRARPSIGPNRAGRRAGSLRSASRHRGERPRPGGRGRRPRRSRRSGRSRRCPRGRPLRAGLARPRSRGGRHPSVTSVPRRRGRRPDTPGDHGRPGSAPPAPAVLGARRPRRRVRRRRRRRASPRARRRHRHGPPAQLERARRLRPQPLSRRRRRRRDAADRRRGDRRHRLPAASPTSWRQRSPDGPPWLRCPAGCPTGARPSASHWASPVPARRCSAPAAAGCRAQRSSASRVERREAPTRITRPARASVGSGTNHRS